MAQQDSLQYKDLLDSSSDEESTHVSTVCTKKRNGHINRDQSGMGTSGLCSIVEKSKPMKRKAENEFRDSKILKMMTSMGYTVGKGLGKMEQGIVNPIEASNHQAKRGLGVTIPGLEADRSAVWDTDEMANVMETVSWLQSSEEPLPDAMELSDWMVIGARKTEIVDECDFCDAEVVEEVVSNKNIFDKLDGREMRQARSRSNPFETVQGLFFQNRAAPKMANMDAVFNFMLTSPVRENGTSLVEPTEPFYFADVCAAPGGFSEYVLWRNKQNNEGLSRVKGFGFTLKENDFKLTDFKAASSTFLEPHYGKHGDGDIFKSENITCFAKFVLNSTSGKGVHLMMADGGFSVEGNECIQEILSKQLYLCQFLTSLAIVRDGGNFVCKVFDLFTPFSVGLIYVMFLCFKKISIHKPNSSRPANSERYLICKGKKSGTRDIEEYLFRVNKKLNSWDSSKSSKDVREVVPFEIMQSNVDFFQYVYESNNVLGKRQIVALKKIQTFCKNSDLVEDRQSFFKSESIKFWRLPNKGRTGFDHGRPAQRAKTILKDPDILNTKIAKLVVENIEEIKSRHDYHFVVLSSSSDSFKQERGIFFGMGGKKVFFYNVNSSTWKSLDTQIELPVDTIVFAELAYEITSRGKTRALHLIDGILLNGHDITNLKLTTRYMHLQMFAKTINKPSDTRITPIRCKELHPLRDIKQILCPDRLSRGIKHKIYLESTLPNNNRIEVNPTGVLFLRNSHRDWTRVYSRREKQLYYFNLTTGTSQFNFVPEIVGCVKTALEKGFYWWWERDVRIVDSEPANIHKVNLQDILHHLDGLRL